MNYVPHRNPAELRASRHRGARRSASCDVEYIQGAFKRPGRAGLLSHRQNINFVLTLECEDDFTCPLLTSFNKDKKTK